MAYALRQPSMAGDTSEISRNNNESIYRSSSYSKRLSPFFDKDIRPVQKSNELVVHANANADSAAKIRHVLDQVAPDTMPKPAAGQGYRFVAIQEWEGIVDFINNGMVTVRLADVRTRGLETDIGEIPIQEFSGSDQRRLKEGAVFRWVIGFQRRGQTQSRISQIVLRHLPAWTIREIREAEAEGLDLSRKLKAQVRPHESA